MIALAHGDCLDLMRNIPDHSVDMVLCDLPYGTTKNKWDVIIPFEPLWFEYERVCKDSAAIILTAAQPFTTLLIMSNFSLFRYALVWMKTTPTGHLNVNVMPLRVHEDIAIFYKRKPTYNAQKTVGHTRKVSTAKHKRNCVKTTNYGDFEPRDYDSTERYPTSIINIPTDRQKTALHPTQKPVALMEYLIKTYTKEGDTVLDNCMGSGTTGVACINTNRSFLGIEKEDKYFQIAWDRIQQAQQEKSNENTNSAMC